jgi:hypothetical protein
MTIPDSREIDKLRAAPEAGFYNIEMKLDRFSRNRVESLEVS